MGTAISLELADPLPADRLAALADGVFAWLHEVDRRFSPFKPDSEVSTHGRPGVTGSPLLHSVLQRCATLWTETGGWFDAYASGRLDPCGYVKGWAVQVASDRLVAAGCANHCLNAGGDVRARGGPDPGRGWRVGIRHPWVADKVCGVVEGTDLAVATSGVYERGHHVVDPFTGRPARGLRSVTVVGAGPGTDLGTVDAYATAALAMGESGMRWLAGLGRPDAVDGLATAVVTDDGRLLTSPGFGTTGER
jgi:thiamine biosynthesis lipoprotein